MGGCGGRECCGWQPPAAEPVVREAASIWVVDAEGQPPRRVPVKAPPPASVLIIDAHGNPLRRVIVAEYTAKGDGKDKAKGKNKCKGFDKGKGDGKGEGLDKGEGEGDDKGEGEGEAGE